MVVCPRCNIIAACTRGRRRSRMRRKHDDEREKKKKGKRGKEREAAWPDRTQKGKGAA